MSYTDQRLHRSIIALLVALLLLAGHAPAAPDSFSPVPSGHWAYPALATLGHAGLLDSSGLHLGDGLLTRYEVAGLIAQAAEQLREGVTEAPGGARTEVALAWLYRMAGRLDPRAAGEVAGVTGLDWLQARRQLYWVVPAVNRLEDAYRAAGAGYGPVGQAAWVGRTATLLYDRLLQELPPALVAGGLPEVERLELALAERLVDGSQSTADLAARVERASRALLRLQSGFGSELQVLDLGMEAPAELPPPERPEVVTLDDLRNATGPEDPPSGEAALETRLPLGSGESLEASVGVKRAPGSTAVRPGVDVGLGVGEARIQAGWRLIDFSGSGVPRGEGEARLELRF